MANNKRKFKTDISENMNSNFLLWRDQEKKSPQNVMNSRSPLTEITTSKCVSSHLTLHINNITLNGYSPLVRVYSVCDHFNTQCPMTVAQPDYLLVTKWAEAAVLQSSW